MSLVQHSQAGVGEERALGRVCVGLAERVPNLALHDVGAERGERRVLANGITALLKTTGIAVVNSGIPRA